MSYLYLYIYTYIFSLKQVWHYTFTWIWFLEINKLYIVIRHFQQIENWFQLTEKFKHAQTFQLIENKNEWWWRWWIVLEEWLTNKRRFCLFSSQENCQGFSPSQTSDKPQAGFESVQSLDSDFVEQICAVVITTTSRHHN